MEEKKNVEIAKTMDSIGYLDVNFQEEFIAELIIDGRFSDNVIDLVQTDHFENEQLRSIISIIKNFYDKYKKTPNFKELNSEITRIVKIELNKETQLKIIDKLKDHKGGDMFVQDMAEKFFLQQNMLKVISEINKIAAKGDVTQYPKMEELLRKVLIQHNRQDIGTYLFDGLAKVYEPNYRNPIPLGLPGLDYILNGGLASDELMILIAPLGSGKTTLSTFVASHVMRSGKKVVQMFFEDTVAQIKQKHAACLHNLKIQDLQNHKEACIEKDKVYEEQFGHNLILKKFKGGNTHVSTIRNYLNKLKTIGFIPELIIIDYLDKLTQEKHEKFATKYEAQDEIVSQIEALCDEFNVAGLTMIQSNRNGIDNERVGVKDSGGSIGRAQIGHVVATLARTNEQKADNIATFCIEKSRVGDAPWEFKDIKFNNSMVQIEIPEELGKQKINGLGFAFEQKTGKTVEQAMADARGSFFEIMKKKDEEEAEKSNNPSVKELEKEVKLNQQELEDNFNKGK